MLAPFPEGSVASAKQFIITERKFVVEVFSGPSPDGFGNFGTDYEAR